jgi:hypothetical protein
MPVYHRSVKICVKLGGGGHLLEKESVVVFDGKCVQGQLSNERPSLFMTAERLIGLKGLGHERIKTKVNCSKSK